MSKVLDYLYLGNLDDARDWEFLESHGIKSIVSILDSQSRKRFPGINYLEIELLDYPTSDIAQFFPRVIAFIHKARLNKESVLVHCLFGISRSVTLVGAYLVAITELPSEDCLKAIKKARLIASPNGGFKKQLRLYYENGAKGAQMKPFREYDSRQVDMTAVKQLIPSRFPAGATS